MGFADLSHDVRFWIVSAITAIGCLLLGIAIIRTGIEHSAVVLSPVALYIFLVTVEHTRIRDQRKTI